MLIIPGKESIREIELFGVTLPNTQNKTTGMNRLRVILVADPGGKFIVTEWAAISDAPQAWGTIASHPP